jgi:hypothetical protein
VLLEGFTKWSKNWELSKVIRLEGAGRGSRNKEKKKVEKI